MKKYIIPIISLILLVNMSSCKESATTSKSKKSSSRAVLLPNITGAAGEVLVVMDNFNWKNNAGDIIRKTLEQEYPALTQPEPLFDVTHITAGAFDDLFKMHRTIVQVSVDESVKSPVVKYGENMWAKPQLVVRIEAGNSYLLEELISKQKDRILQNILLYDRKRLQDIYNDSKDQDIRNILAKYNVNLALPRGYNTDLSTDDFASFSIETTKTSQVIFVYQYPYKNEKDFETKNIIKKRNAFLKKYTIGSRDDSYLTTAEMFPPFTYDIKKNGENIVEVRGWWELYNGYMGGPFLSHTLLDKKRNKIVVVEGYVYYPNNKKRNMMRQLEAIVYSAEFLDK